MAIRVFQVAKDFQRTPQEILQILKEGGVHLKSHTSELDNHARHVLRTKLHEYKLTVVDDVDGGVLEVKQTPPNKSQGKILRSKGSKSKKANKKKEPRKVMEVRVIKRHPVKKPEEDVVEKASLDAEAAPETETAPEVETAPEIEKKFADEKKVLAPRQPRLKRPRPRSSSIQNRISMKIQEKMNVVRQHEVTEPSASSGAPVKTPVAASSSSDQAVQQRQAPRTEQQHRGERPPYRKPDSYKGQRPSEGQQRSDRPYQGNQPNRSSYQGNQSNRPPHKGGQSGRPPYQGNQSGRPPYQGNQSGRPPYQGNQSGRPPYQGNQSDRPPYQGNQSGRPPYQGNQSNRPPYQGNRDGRPAQRPNDRPSFRDRRTDAQRGRSGTSMALSFKMAQTGSKPGGAAPLSAFTKAPTKGPARPTRFAPVGKASKRKRKKRKDQENLQKLRSMTPTVSKVVLPDEDLGIVMLPDGVTVKLLAEKVNRMAKDIIKRLFEKGVFATINDVLDEELAVDIAKDFGYLAEIIPVEEVLQMEDEEFLDQEEQGGEKLKRAPIVTILGHVDHGKTSLLDFIRATQVAESEAGGITQHIGAYQVDCKGEPIVFLDTPGHEAFTKMRARGTSVTDIVILVVAADDGVKPQTVEAISHAKAAKVPIIVAINKIDKPEAQPDRVKQMLTEHELIVEEYGGDAPCVLVSAKTGDGISDLLEMILLVSEMQSFTANPMKRGIGSVIEAKLERGRGSVASVLVQDGTIRIGDAFISGQTFGKIRALYSYTGKKVQEAGPSTPVEILGCNDVPQAGDSFMIVASEVKAREISSFRKERAREEQLKRQKKASLDQLFSAVQKNEVAELPVIIKGDVQGSVEGLCHALEGIKSEKVQLRIIHQAVGSVTENDILLAVASKAIIIGFRVRAERPAHTLSQREQIEVRYYSIIYEAIQDVEAAMLGLVAPEYKEVIIGKATVRQVFQIPKIGKIAGSYIEDGKVTKDAKARLMRNGKMIFEGDIDTLKRFKDDVNEVKLGFECGIGMLGFDEYEEGDLFEIYKMESVRATKLT